MKNFDKVSMAWMKFFDSVGNLRGRSKTLTGKLHWA